MVTRWLTTGQRLVYMWTRVHGLTGDALRVMKIIVRFCLTHYSKLIFDVKVKHYIEDAPYHILTSLRILKPQPKKVKDAITFYVRTGAWYAHPECLLLSLLSSSNSKDRQFAVNQILKLRGGNKYGDNTVRPRTTPKLNLSATSLIKLITWEEGQVQEPSFTCSRSTAVIQSYLKIPYSPPKYSSHTQSTERYIISPQLTYIHIFLDV